MERNLNLVAFDCGNSSIRTILCRFDGERVKSELVLQEPNEILELEGYYYWDMPQIFEILKRGLSLAAKRVDKIDSIGICTWGIDFQLSAGGGAEGNVLPHRDSLR